MVAKSKKDIMTLDKLALMVARGFEQVDTRFAREEFDGRIMRSELSEIKQEVAHTRLELKETKVELKDEIADLGAEVKKLTKSNKEDLNAFGKDILLLKQKIGLKTLDRV